MANAGCELRRCHELWGRAGVSNLLPNVHVVRDAFYIPWSSHEAAWGVFDSDGRPIRAGMDFRTEDHLASGLVPSFDPTLDFVAADHEVMMYCGMLNAHYGHFIINSLPRLWPVIKPICPPILAHIPTTDRQSYEDLPFFARIVERLGLSMSSIHIPEQPLRIAKLLVPETSLVEQLMVHRVYADLCSQIGRQIWSEAETDTDEVPAYIAKSRLQGGVGKFEGEELIVEWLSRDGVDIVFPEELSFDDQVKLLSRKTLIIGTTGSAFHTTLFSAPNRRIVGINQSSAVNSNFVMIDRLAQNDAAYYYVDGMQSESGGEFLTLHRPPDPEAFAKAVAERVAIEREAGRRVSRRSHLLPSDAPCPKDALSPT